MLTAPANLGVYIHVPFCRRKCPYCDFAITVSSRPPVAEYHEMVRRELGSRAHEAEARTLRSVYFGGGTPSMSSVSDLAETLRQVRSVLGGSPEEVTLEVNPEDGAQLDYKGLLSAGFTRLSFGAQSFDPDVLRLLGRAHTPAQVRDCVRESAEAGFEALSIDLIHGVPGQAEGRLERDLQEIVTLEELDHVSIYELTVEPKTSFARRRSRGELPELSERHLADELALITSRLKAAGIERYEVSSYARPGAEAVHNSGYWAGVEYLGLGVGAHSLRVEHGVAARRVNGRSTRRYLEAPLANSETVTLSTREYLTERMLVGLRTTRGVDLSELGEWAAAELDLLEPLFQAWIESGLVTQAARGLVPTDLGLLVADTLAADVVDVLL